MIRKYVLMGFVCLSVLSACKKKKEEEPTPQKSTSEKLAGKWMLFNVTADKKVVYRSGEIASENVYNQMPACEKDDSLVFFNTGMPKTGYSDMGLLNCQTSWPQRSPFTWVLSSDTILTMNQNTYSQVFVLEELTDQILKIHAPTQDVNDFDYIESRTYIRK